MIQVHQNGELITELEKVGFRSILSAFELQNFIFSKI